MQGIDSVPDDRQTVGKAVRELYHDKAGNPRVETWLLEDFPHAVPIQMDGNPNACGSKADYVLDASICAVRRIAEFWHLR